jgi:hypothetical protein
MRIRPAHYTIKTAWLRSWVVESSLDFVNWTEIDLKTDNEDFKPLVPKKASFSVQKSAECRFIRLTQTGTRLNGDDCLSICATESFGTILE